ncbi:hypothetical protein K0B04_03435 [Patescibacteria group bacterium]|nr:hypothetical protein [Patescibacteria group bacterium]
MKEIINWVNNTINRFISNEAVAVKIYIYWGLVTLLFFGFFGFYPVSKIFISNVKVLDEMYQNNLKLEKKIEELKIAKEKIDIVGDDFKILDQFLPDDFEPQTYMVELALLAGESGYSLDRISFGKIDKSRVSMTLGITGKGNLIDLVRSIETSGRITEIENIRLSIGDRENTLNMSIQSFIMEIR